MDFVDKEDDFPIALDDLLHDTFEPLFEFALVLGARDKRAHVQGIDLPALEVLWDVPVHDLAGDALRNSGLADARFSDQDRVILGPSREDLQHPPDLVIPPDDWIQLAFGGQVVEIDGKPREETVLIVVGIHSLFSFLSSGVCKTTAVCSGEQTAIVK